MHKHLGVAFLALVLVACNLLPTPLPTLPTPAPTLPAPTPTTPPPSVGAPLKPTPGPPVDAPSIVAPPIDSGVPTDFAKATGFIYSGPNPIQVGVVSGTIETRRAAVLSGRVLKADGLALSDVVITVLGHPEYGHTLSRTDGQFDIAANGGGEIVLSFAKTGYLSVQRQLGTGWNTYTGAPDVVMINEDTNTTLVDLAADIPVQVARGSVVSDTDGVRQQTLLFPKGTRAFMVFTDGTTRTITSMHVRMTEYTVGPDGEKAMPAELPPTTAYTYASVFHADEAVAAGAVDVRFEPPIISYVENFLNFATGITIPMGYYDTDIGAWVPSDSGRVVKVLRISEGKIDLDLDGSNVAATTSMLLALGVSDPERETLANLYPAGQSLWRVPVPHFDLPWDQNQGTGPDEPAPPPDTPVPDTAHDEHPDCESGSIIECQNQVLGETLDLVGTPYLLHYRSSRMLGYTLANVTRIPLTGPKISPKLKAVELEIDVAGQNVAIIFKPAPNLNYTFVWDGKDRFKRPILGKTFMVVKLTYVYPLIYKATSRFGHHGETEAVAIGFDTSRSEFRIKRLWSQPIGKWQELTADLGGWTLDVHHVYDPQAKTLYRGDGRQFSTDVLNFTTIATAAGNGTAGFGGDGGPAAQARLFYASNVAVDQEGSIYIADTLNQRIRKVSRSGTITTIAGKGGTCGKGSACGDDGPAIEAQFLGPRGLAIGPDQSVYVADFTNDRIRKIGKDGIIRNVAGTGIVCLQEDSCGDGGPATKAQLSRPVALAFGSDGSLYISDTGSERIRRVGTDGLISTVAGIGQPAGFSGDGGPATKAQLSDPQGIAVSRDGYLYIADSGNKRIRRVGPDGIITTVVGTGQVCTVAVVPCGDGELATRAILYNPHGVALGPDGSIYIADTYSQIVRRVRPDGYIMRIAGNYLEPNAGKDGQPALQTNLNFPDDLAVGPDGALYVADTKNFQIRKVSSQVPGNAEGYILIASEDDSEVYWFDSTGRHLRTVYSLTGATKYEFEYDGHGHLSSVTDGDGNVTSVVRDAESKPIGILGPYGQRTTFTLDPDGFLASVANPAGEVVHLAYATGGLLSSYQDPRGNVHTFEYDWAGRLLRDTNPSSGYEILSRTEGSRGYTVTTMNALGMVTQYGVDKSPSGDERHNNIYPGNLQSESVRRANATLSSRAANGVTSDVTLGPDPRWGMFSPIETLKTISLPSGLALSVQMTRTSSVTNSANPFSLTAITRTLTLNGRSFSRVFQNATRTVTETTPAGRRTVTKLDELERPVKVQVANLAPTEYVYDVRGRPSMVTMGTGPGARKTTFAYNSAGYLSSVTDPVNRTASFEYDLTGRVVREVLPDGRAISYTYDLNGNLASLAPPGRPVHMFDYTPVDLVSRYAPPDVNAGSDDTLYAYNRDKQITRITHPDGQTIGAGYDGAGRLNALTLARGSLALSYDTSTGNLASVSAPGGIKLSYTYDGSLLKGTELIGPVVGTTTYTYDNNLRLVASTVNATAPIAYRYDDDGMLIQSGALILRRDAQNGFLTGTTLGGVTDSISYNSFGEEIGYQAVYAATPLLDVQFSRDQLGRIITKTEVVVGETTKYIYTYDLAGRLTGVMANSATVATYTYDSNGNRTGFFRPGSTITGTYDAQDRLLQYGTTTYNYTANGELLTKVDGGQEANYQYDALGNLVTVTLPNNVQIAYLIDGQNRRVGKLLNRTLVQGVIYDSQLRLAAETDGFGNIVSRFVYATRPNVPDYMVRDGVTYRLLLDLLGSPRLIINAVNGNIAQRIDYDAFGNVLVDTNPGFQPFGFAGGLRDRDTGFVHFGARDYEPQTGRWTQKDPIAFAGRDTNLYSYVSNQPLSQIDPSGLGGIIVAAQVGGGLGAGYSFGSGLYIGSEGIFSFQSIGGGFLVGIYGGAGLVVGLVWDPEGFKEHGTEYGVDTPVLGGCVYQSNRDGQTWFRGPLVGVAISIGPGMIGDVHAEKSYTYASPTLRWSDVLEQIERLAVWLQE